MKMKQNPSSYKHGDVRSGIPFHMEKDGRCRPLDRKYQLNSADMVWGRALIVLSRSQGCQRPLKLSAKRQTDSAKMQPDENGGYYIISKTF